MQDSACSCAFKSLESLTIVVTESHESCNDPDFVRFGNDIVLVEIQDKPGEY